MKYYEKDFLEKVEKIFDEYYDTFKIDDLEYVDRFTITREFQGALFLDSSKDGVINKLRNFIEFFHPIVFRISDRDRDILEIFLSIDKWSCYPLDWEKRKTILKTEKQQIDKCERCPFLIVVRSVPESKKIRNATNFHCNHYGRDLSDIFKKPDFCKIEKIDITKKD